MGTDGSDPPRLTAASRTAAAHGVADVRQLELVNAIARIAAHDLRLRPMLQRITDAMSDTFGWEFVACITIDEEEDRFICQALTTTVPTQVHVGYSRPLGSGVVGQVAQTGELILLDDVLGVENFVETMGGTRSELCLPVIHQSKVVAILNLESRSPGVFHDQVPLLQTIADQVAGAIASARLYEELETRASLLQMLSEIVVIGLEGNDIADILARVVDFVHARFPLSTTAIALLEPDGTHGVLAASAGLQIEGALGSRFPIDTGIVGRALRTGQDQFVSDLPSDPDYLPLAAGIRAEYVVPIRFRGEILGAFNFESASPATFTNATKLVLRTIADQIAGAIHLAAMNDRLRQMTERLEQTNRDLASANLRLEALSTTDPLTGVYNRRKFDQELEIEWRRSFRSASPIGCLMIDVDCFKHYNDLFGHPAGDRCLQMIATTLEGGLRRAADLLARVGGEEFAVMLTDTDEERAVAHAESLRAAIEKLNISHPESPFGIVTISAGVGVLIPSNESTPEDLWECADAALYAAKQAGRNLVRLA